MGITVIKIQKKVKSVYVSANLFYIKHRLNQELNRTFDKTQSALLSVSCLRFKLKTFYLCSIEPSNHYCNIVLLSTQFEYKAHIYAFGLYVYFFKRYLRE